MADQQTLGGQKFKIYRFFRSETRMKNSLLLLTRFMIRQDMYTHNKIRPDIISESHIIKTRGGKTDKKHTRANLLPISSYTIFGRE